MSDLNVRIADAERRLRFAETSQTRLAAIADLDHLNACKLADAQHEADAANAQRLAELGISSPAN